MPRVTRSREIAASPEKVWRVISDPNSLPRWWPRVIRVEAVEKTKAGERSQWTAVLGTKNGRGVRADYRCLHSTNNQRYVWEQQLEGSPFAKHLAAATTEIRLEEKGEATRVQIVSVQKLRGLSRLGSPMMKGAGKRLLDEALEGLSDALVQRSAGKSENGG